MHEILNNRLNDRRGQTVIEYVLVLVLIVLLLFAAFKAGDVPGAIGTAADNIESYLTTD